MGRKESLNTILLLGIILSRCNSHQESAQPPTGGVPTVEPSRRPTETPPSTEVVWVRPSFTPPPSEIPTLTKAPLPSITPKLEVPSPITPQETSTPLFRESDQENRMLVETAMDGDPIILNDLLIKYIVRLPRPLTSDAIYGIAVTGEGDFLAIIENFNCEFDDLVSESRLGEQVESPVAPINSGVWETDIRFASLDANVFVASSVGTVPVLTSESYQIDQGDETQVCHKNSAFEGIGDLPRRTAEITGILLKEIYEGLREGLSEDN